MDEPIDQRGGDLKSNWAINLFSARFGPSKTCPATGCSHPKFLTTKRAFSCPSPGQWIFG